MEVENQNNTEFKVAGLTMEKLSIYYGLFFTYRCIRSFIHARKMRELGNSE
tara:strand:+ start:534 stop:686 length:153 start_codon:yes stop_codon:yes gene_type:complete